MRFTSRQSAGRKLALELKKHLVADKEVVIIALPRGGVVLGAEIAKELHAPLSVLLVRKIGHPDYPEYAIGAVAENEEPIYNKDEVMFLDRAWLEEAETIARNRMIYRRQMYFNDYLTPPSTTSKTVVVVDDGIATGLTMEAALQSLKRQHPRRIVVAVPVASEECLKAFRNLADEIVVLADPKDFAGSIGAHYYRFPQIDDIEVRTLLREVANGLQPITP